jgi:hypothetical protein
MPRRKGDSRRRWVFALAPVLLSLLMLVDFPGASIGQDVGTVISREYAIKAGFLYHFSTYVQWPRDVFPADGKPFVIGVYGSNPFGDALIKIAMRKKVDGQPIEIRHITSVKEALACQIVFIPRTVPLQEQAAVLKATIGFPVLTVGEIDGFVQRGGVVQFFLENNKVRIAFGEKSHLRDDLKVSSKLLAVAKMIPSQ